MKKKDGSLTRSQVFKDPTAGATAKRRWKERR